MGARATEFRILGPIEVLSGEEVVALGAPKQRALLGLLLVNANDVVSRERVVDCLWADEPPARASNAVQVYVHGLRKAIGSERIVTTGAGYQLRVEDDEVDLRRFERLVDEGRAALEDGRAADAAELLAQATELWRGEPLADLEFGSFPETERGRLAEQRLEATELRIDATLALGRHAAVVSELQALVGTYPYRERLQGQLMLALYRCDRQADALEAFQAARRALSDELGIDPSLRLRELERAILRHDPSLRIDVTARPFRVPRPLTRTVGRGMEVAAVCALLREEDVRLLTLTGPGGVGKTRLALEVAAELAPGLAGGALFVDLAPLDDHSLLAPTIASALGIGELPGDAAMATLVAELDGREALLVLDNFESLLPAAALVAEILANTSTVRVLTTSRVLLRIRDEQEYEVPPLATGDAASLFVERVRRVVTDFDLDASNDSVVAAICSRLDGLPLALELAAPRVRLLSPEALLARLDRSLPVLTGGSVDTHPHQQTLRATLDWSYSLLGDAERSLLARLAVFVGGWTLDAAEAVCADGLDVLTAMATLLDNSLLRRRQGAGGEVRFGMLMTIRDYAAELLEASPEEAAMRDRHAEYFLGLAEAADAAAKAAGGEVELERLEQEHDNLRAALARLHLAEDPEPELRLVDALSRFWWLRGHATEGRRWLAAALERPGQPPPLRAETLRRAAVLAGVQGDYEVARALAEEGRELYESIGDRRGVALSLSSIAESLLHEGEHGRSGQLYEEAAALFAEMGADWDVAAATVNLGYVALGQGDYARAASLAESGLAHFEELGDPQSTATAVYVLGAAGVFGGEDGSGPRAQLERSLQLFGDVRDREGAAECLHALATAFAQDDPVLAAELVGAAEALREEIGSSLARFQLEWRDRTVADLRAQLGDETWHESVERGRATTLETAADRVRGSLEHA